MASRRVLINNRPPPPVDNNNRELMEATRPRMSPKPKSNSSFLIRKKFGNGCEKIFAQVVFHYWTCLITLYSAPIIDPTDKVYHSANYCIYMIITSYRLSTQHTDHLFSKFYFLMCFQIITNSSFICSLAHVNMTWKSTLIFQWSVTLMY